MIDRHLVFLDLETTGASPDADRITEIGLVEVDRGQWLDEWSTLVNPGRSIPANIQGLTGITDAMVAQAPAFRDLAPDLHRRLQGKVLVAHNARFDHGFLAAEFRRLGLAFDPEILCTVRLSRRLFPQHPRHNLDSLIERHGLPCEHRHRALGDAKVLWEFTKEILVEPGLARVQEAVAALLRRPVLPGTLAANALDDIPSGPGVYAVHAADDTALYVGRTMNLSSRIRAHFTGESRSTRDRRIAVDAARIDWTQTAGELGAIFRQARWVDRLAPLFNRKPVRRNGYCSLRWDVVDGPQIPAFVDMDDPDFRGGGAPLYGLFRSRKIAANALRELADAHALCHIALGIEAGRGPCLGYRLKQCRGACAGEENPIAHAMRMTQALHPLRLPAWPFPGAIGLRESDAASGRHEIHVFDHWRWLGSYEDAGALEEGLRTRENGAFDYETWRLLRRYLADLPAGVDIIPLTPAIALPGIR